GEVEDLGLGDAEGEVLPAVVLADDEEGVDPRVEEREERSLGEARGRVLRHPVRVAEVERPETEQLAPQGALEVVDAAIAREERRVGAKAEERREQAGGDLPRERARVRPGGAVRDEDMGVTLG